MAQGTIKKGFFFYFGLFVLLLIAAFFVCVVVMIFNPGKTILWMQYFTDNAHFVLKDPVDNQSNIDLSSVTDLQINCSYAKVTVEKTTAYKDEGIHIINSAKGFAVAKDAVKFNVTAHYEGSKLIVNLTEPKGFLYFSNNIQIVLHMNASSQNNFDKMNLTINTTSGDVVLGETYQGGKEVRMNSVKVTTGKGDIMIYEPFSTLSLKDVGGNAGLTLETSTGKIMCSKKVSYTEDGTKIANGLDLNSNCFIKSSKSSINISIIKLENSHTLQLVGPNGNFNIDRIFAKTVNITCVDGHYIFGRINGDLSFVDSEDTMASPYIKADYISGNFSISTPGSSSKPDINLGEVGGKIFVSSSSGSLDVDSVKGQVEVISNGSLGVNLYVAAGNSNQIAITTGSGAVNVEFEKGFGTVDVSTVGGNVTFSFTSQVSFDGTVYNVKEGESADVLRDANYIDVNFEVASKNPISVTGDGSVSGKGSITVHTNAKVAYRLVAIKP